jgi:hypothetical protein
MNSQTGNKIRHDSDLAIASESDCAPSSMPIGCCVDTSSAGPLSDSTHMDRIIVTRPSLIEPTIAQKPVVLLTGAWPHTPAKSVVELDVAIDRRFTWIDKEAERLAEVVGGEVLDHGSTLSAPWVNVLALRYYLVRLLRVIEFFTRIQPPEKGERVHVIADRADRDEVALVAALCRQASARCTVQWHGMEKESVQAGAEPEEWWRRALRRLASRLPTRKEGLAGPARVVLCGNPRFLDPLCHILHERGCHVWWLYDRLAVKPLFQWLPKGIEQLTCQDDSLPTDMADEPIKLPRIEFRGVDLRALVSDWLSERLASRRHDQRRWKRQIEGHFQHIRPELLVMDEDATPMKRIALATARRYGGKSYVVQHGAPVARFGFAPLAADGIFVWGRSTREQLQRWDVPAERVFVTGSPSHDRLYQALQKRPGQNARSEAPPRILLLATVPPRDERPDVIEMNMNSRTYGEMIEAAFAAVESVPGATLVVKPHPRTQEDSAVLGATARHDSLKVEQSKSRSLADALRGVDCVLSCLSSAGIEATLAGLPVIQLVPRGAGQILPHDQWGLAGSASNAEELLPLIREVLQARGRIKRAAFGDVFANASFWGRTSDNVPDAATRIAEILLDQVTLPSQGKQSRTKSRTREEQGSSTTVASQ